MEQQISLFLLFALFTSGNALFCNQCPGKSEPCDKIPCPPGLTSCFGTTAYASALGISQELLTVKSCAPANTCPSGSVNIGNFKLSSYCCSTTDFCNDQSAPDTSLNVPNGNMCYTCVGLNCTNLMICSGSEFNCLKATWKIGGETLGVKGCVTKSICDAASFLPDIEGVSCCEGYLCNGAQSVVQSLMILCVPLLSFILML